MSRVGAWALALLGLVAGSCVPPPPEQTLARRYDEETTMGQLQRAGSIRVGVTTEAPPLGYVDPATGSVRGFTVSLGRTLADTLGVRPEFVAAPAPRLLELVEQRRVDVVFPNVPLTEEAVRQHSYTTPYLITHQRLLVPRSARVTELSDLAGRRVCAAINETTQVSPKVLEPRVSVLPAPSVRECMAPFRRHAVDAVTAEEVYLEWMVAHLGEATRAKVVGDQLSTEGLGAAVTTGGGWLAFVNAVFAASELDGTWSAAYARWLGGEPAQPPELTAEEAAALFPTAE